jgi:hypothetical protein
VLKVPVAWNWNTTFQRDIGWGTTIEVGYVGRRGIHNQRKRNINQLLPGTVQANPGVNVNALRPFLGMGILGLAENSGLSMYNGLQISAQRRFASGLQFDVDDRIVPELLDHGAVGAGPHESAVPALARGEPQRIDDDRLPRPGLAGEHVQARPERDGQRLDDGEVTDPELSEHLRTPPTRSAFAPF